MSKNYRLAIRWMDVPGLPRESIDMTAPATMIAAALKELCSSSYALEGVADLRVHPA